MQKITGIREEEYCCPCSKINNEVVISELKELEISNDLFQLPAIVNQCLLNVTKRFGDIDLLKIGLHEILVNAIEHGNLEITSKEKQRIRETNQNYYNYTRQRGKLPKYLQRRVYITVARSLDKLVITIRDDGSGFDWVQEKKRINELSVDEYTPCGRGILMAQRAYDQVNFNQAGNAVELVKLAVEK
ncbi:ATP-binding protein [Desulforamulus ferrireducens]|uniref:Histidine kinase/HSP90-like ATPase domain-containing protein n=1 Tax=Desulforamulus ferrireducens TaxID=1833852 RepID=A0A1S6IUW3_9FIRM|nr:ATP-binding protein [Desulforamulus ferrireducens]AQS58567.1 hypothetical protein B0537_05380 [Desulforamulus ferrireducens]